MTCDSVSTKALLPWRTFVFVSIFLILHLVGDLLLYSLSERFPVLWLYSVEFLFTVSTNTTTLDRNVYGTNITYM